MEPLFWPNTGLPVRNLRRQLTHGQLFWREVGRGQTVVFLHGSWHDGDQWGEVLPQLGLQYHCLAPDLIGFGESQRLQEASAYSIALEVNTLAELLDALRLDTVVLVGHSLGAWVAASFALRYPERVQGLCVLEPEGLTYEPKRWRRARWLISPLGRLWLLLIKPFARRSTPGNSPSWLQNFHFQRLLIRHAAACRLLFRRRRKELEPEMVGARLGALLMPTVVLQGEGADNTSQRLTEAFRLAAPGAKVKILPGNDELPSCGGDAIATFLHHWLPQL